MISTHRERAKIRDAVTAGMSQRDVEQLRRGLRRVIDDLDRPDWTGDVPATAAGSTEER